MVPEAPPPTIATGTCRSDFVVRPVLRVGRAGFALCHVVVHAADRPASRLCKDPRYDSVDQTGEPRADQSHSNCDRSDAMSRPTHAERAWMFEKKPCGHSPVLP